MSENAIVYVVDDDESVQNGLQRLLRAAGYCARTYGSAQALLDARSANEEPLAVVLTDLRMPGIDGLALAEQLNHAAMPPPIVFLSAHGNVSETVRAMKAGAEDFLEKPVEMEELLGALRRAFARSRERLEEGQQLAELRARYARLTPRERQVFALVVAGLLNKQVAWELGTSEKTIKVHRARVVEKMRAQSLPDLVRMAGRLGIPVRLTLEEPPQPPQPSA